MWEGPVSESEYEVVVAGGGPTGMMLAAELALAGVEVVIAERRSEPGAAGSRAGGLQARTLEIFDQRGIVDRFLEEGQPAQVHGFGAARLDMSDFPTRHPYGLGLWQNHTERILAGWVGELGVPVLRGHAVTGFTQDGEGVTIETDAGAPTRARYLVGCDGGRSAVRRAAGIGFPGWEASTSSLIAEAEMSAEPELGIRRDARGTHGIGRVEYEMRDGEPVFGDSGPVRLTVAEDRVTEGRPTLGDVSAALVAVYGTDFGIHSPTWISRFTDATRQADSYRAGRVLIAGDAAHVHSPVGGHGLSIGVQDAVNLGWKLAQVVRGTSPDSLLDTYEAERHPATARLLRTTMAQTALMRTDERTEALREVVSELAAMDEPRRYLAGRASGLDIHYDLGGDHALVGRRMPDLDLETPEGPKRVFDYMHGGRPLLVSLGEGGDVGGSRPATRVQSVGASFGGRWELPVLGEVPAPSAVLVRPDGYVAWVGEGTGHGLDEAVQRWFGGP